MRPHNAHFSLAADVWGPRRFRATTSSLGGQAFRSSR
jgi:hypothetical protein